MANGTQRSRRTLQALALSSMIGVGVASLPAQTATAATSDCHSMYIKDPGGYGCMWSSGQPDSFPGASSRTNGTIGTASAQPDGTAKLRGTGLPATTARGGWRFQLGQWFRGSGPKQKVTLFGSLDYRHQLHGAHSEAHVLATRGASTCGEAHLPLTGASGTQSLSMPTSCAAGDGDLTVVVEIVDKAGLVGSFDGNYELNHLTVDFDDGVTCADVPQFCFGM